MTNRIKTISIVIAVILVSAGGYMGWQKAKSGSQSNGNRETASSSGATSSNPESQQAANGAPGSQDSQNSKVSMPPLANKNSLNPRSESASTKSPSGETVAHGTSGDAAPVVAAPGTNLPAGVEPKPEVALSGCFETRFQHPKKPGHADTESCHHHKNRIRLAHTIQELKGLCVRIDDEPVAFEKTKGNDLIVAAEAGPDSVIRVSYCIGSSQCNSDCKIKPKKDTFLEAVGGVAGDEKNSGEIAEWDSEGASAADKKAVREVASEIKALEGELRDSGDDKEEQAEFSGWIAGTENATSCEIRKQAHENSKKESPRG